MKWFFLGSLSAFLSVAFGAFGAHALKEKISPHFLEIFQTGVHYQMFHSLALLFLGLFTIQKNIHLNASGWFFFCGIILFSGSLYILSLTGIRSFGMITPFGGVCFLLGWMILIVKVWKIWKT